MDGWDRQRQRGRYIGGKTEGKRQKTEDREERKMRGREKGIGGRPNR
jgi:hypothetical protein